MLIDPGATYSFVSMDFATIANIEMKLIDCSIMVFIPAGDSLLVDKVYMGSKVIIGGQKFLADLILLDIHKFDVILRMD